MKIDTALAEIAKIVGPRGVVDGADAEALLVDERGLYHGAAALIVRPASTLECAGVMKICNEASIGVVPQGGNTGYCGGATPFDGANQILLSLSRMNRVREIDPVGFTMTVEAGLVLAKAQALASEQDLFFPLSLGSEGSCQIGGNLSTNAGGLAVLRYGSARDLVLGLEVVLPSGEVLKVLWQLREGTVRDVHSVLSERGRSWAYTTVLTLLRRLRTKGYVESREDGVAHVFKPAVSRAGLIGNRLDELADQLCDGTATPLVQALVDRERLSPGDVAELRGLLDRLEADPESAGEGEST